MDMPSVDRAFSRRELDRLLSERRFELYYQPQYRSREGGIAGVEGLVRLRDSGGSLILPQHFVAKIERTKLIHEFGAELFAQGCRDAAHFPGLTIAINVSPKQFDDPNLPRRFTEIAHSAGVDPRRLEIEITESLLFKRPEHAQSALNSLNESGFSLALDDFGTGYSSLAALLQFPIKKIKIDRSFVQGTPLDRRSVAIVQAIVALSRALGLQVVAEGVETETQRSFLRAAGCHLLQGFFLSKALTREELVAALARPCEAASLQ